MGMEHAWNLQSPVWCHESSASLQHLDPKDEPTMALGVSLHMQIFGSSIFPQAPTTSVSKVVGVGCKGV